MPNTLAHLGVQAMVTRGVVRDAPYGWIWLGCVLPDLPWISQRALRAIPFDLLSPVDIRLHAIVQSSLLFCLIGALAVALLTVRPVHVFAIVAAGSGLHLLLDATQTKWGNGVILTAPFDWRVVNFGLYWPEHGVTIGLTVFGLVVFAIACLAPDVKPMSHSTGRRRPMLAALVGAIWLIGPVWFWPAAEADDAHFTRTLRLIDARPGQAVAFDRAGVDWQTGDAQLRVWTGETLAISGLEVPEGTVRLSIKGRFETADTVEITALKVHAPGWRDWMSYLGLAMVAAWWLMSGLRAWRK